MNTAYQRINHSYSIEISQPPLSITCFDVSEPARLAAIACGEIVYIWNLHKHMYTHQLTSKDTNRSIKQICFNNDASKIMALLGNYCCAIKIWDFSDKLFFYVETKFPVDHISFATAVNSNKTIVHAYSLDENAEAKKAKKDTIVTTYCIKSRNKYIESNSPSFCKLRGYIPSNYCTVKQGKYSMRLSPNRTSLIIEKEKCRALYICEKAIKNTEHETSLPIIKKSQSYQSLTEYEQKLINLAIERKIIRLEAAAVKQLIENK